MKKKKEAFSESSDFSNVEPESGSVILNLWSIPVAFGLSVPLKMCLLLQMWELSKASYCVATTNYLIIGDVFKVPLQSDLCFSSRSCS